MSKNLIRLMKFFIFFEARKKRQERVFPSLKLFKHKSKSEPLTRYKYLVRIILIWCRIF